MRVGVAGVNVAVSIRDMLREAFDAGRTEAKKRATTSHWKYWLSFCEAWGIDPDKFGSVRNASGEASTLELAKELEVLSGFATFVVYFPRSSTGKTNSVDYAESLISTIRTRYALENGRRPGLVHGPRGSCFLSRVLRGLRRLAPSIRKPREPVLQQHLRAIKVRLDLCNSQRDRMFWALWLVQWQGVMRSADVIKSKKDSARPWDPARDTHRGRVGVDIVKDLQDSRNRVRISLAVKPTKTDVGGESGFVKTFILDDDPTSLSAAAAVFEMLKRDPDGDHISKVPLFLDPATRKEVVIEESVKRLRECLTSAGLPNLATGAHCLRIGGATAYANSLDGGDLVAGLMGLWRSDAKDGYIHACAPRLEYAGRRIAMESGMALADRPGPVASYARRPSGH